MPRAKSQTPDDKYKRQRAWKERQLAQGLCVTCPKPRVNATHCEVHAEKNRQKVRRHYYKRRDEK